MTNLVDHLVRTAEDHGPMRPALRIEMGARDGTPAALLAGLGHALDIALSKLVARLLERRCDVAKGMHADLQLIERVPGPAASLTVEVHQRAESSRISADDRDHERQPKGASARERSRA